MPTLTRGPLPAGVYWRRRMFVLALAGTLVFVIASWLGGGSDASDDEVPVAQQAGGEVEASQTITVRDRPKGRKAKRNAGPIGPTFDPSVLVEPDGNCDPADVRITPRVEEAVAGEEVTIGLSLQTVQADACYFRIGPDKIALKITRRGQEIWTSRECPDGVPAESVVVRRAVATVVPMTWDARASDPTCSNRRQWLFPNGFEITAAALGGEPTGTDFELASAAPETSPPDPKKDRKGKRDRGGLENETAQEEAQGDQSGQRASDRSTDEPRR